MIPPPPRSPLFPYTTLFRSDRAREDHSRAAREFIDARDRRDRVAHARRGARRGRQTGHPGRAWLVRGAEDRKSTRLNSSHANISYAVFCLKKKKRYKQVRET